MKKDESKICSKECKWCQPYNEGWAVCWHSRIKSSKVQLGVECKVQTMKRILADLNKKG